MKPRIETATNQVKIDLETIQLLERLSLVDFANVNGLQRLEVCNAAGFFFKANLFYIYSLSLR